MTLALQDVGFDLGQIVQVLVVFFLFVLPALRGIVKSRQQKEEHGERRRGAPEGEVYDERREPAGRDAWERLLRGESVEPRPVEPVELEDVFEEVRDYAEPVPEPTPVPLPVPEPRERVADRATWHPEADRRVAPAAGRPALSTALDSSGGRAFAAFDTLGEPASPAVAALEVRAAPRVLGGVDWRRAIVLAEVLGCPVAMRDGPVFPGTPVGPS